MIDLKLLANTQGIYDLSILDGALETINSFDTSLIMSFYGEARADQSEIAVPQNQRGWWGNFYNNSPDPNYEYGGKLWLLYQARCNLETLNLGTSYLQDAFQWYIDDGYASDVEVLGTMTSKTQIQYNITIYTPNNETINKSFPLWQSTGVS